jgi:hypothetical protein
MDEGVYLQSQLAYDAAMRAYRAQRTAYFERLALLDGGVVALLITAILGPMHGQVPHKWLLGFGLTALVAAMIALLNRNLAAMIQEYDATLIAHDSRAASFENSAQRFAKVARRLYWTEIAGIVLTQTGVFALLAYVLTMLGHQQLGK